MPPNKRLDLKRVSPEPAAPAQLIELRFAGYAPCSTDMQERRGRWLIE